MVAVRQAMDFESTGRAIVVVLLAFVIGAIPWIILLIVQGILLGGEATETTRGLLGLIGLA